jgi:hypothetical protein
MTRLRHDTFVNFFIMFVIVLVVALSSVLTGGGFELGEGAIAGQGIRAPSFIQTDSSFSISDLKDVDGFANFDPTSFVGVGGVVISMNPENMINYMESFDEEISVNTMRGLNSLQESLSGSEAVVLSSNVADNLNSRKNGIRYI